MAELKKLTFATRCVAQWELTGENAKSTLTGSIEMHELRVEELAGRSSPGNRDKRHGQYYRDGRT